LLDRRTVEPHQKIVRKEHKSAQRCEKWRVWYVKGCCCSKRKDWVPEYDYSVRKALCEIEGEIDQQGRNKEDAEERHDLKEDGKFVEPCRLGRICAIYHEHQEKEQEIDDRGQAR
jgi:hypothetical protein